MIIPLYEEWDYPKECTNFVFLGMAENGDSLPFEIKEWNKNVIYIVSFYDIFAVGYFAARSY